MSQNDFLFASGGLKDGLDIAKCIALGGMAGQFLKATAVSMERTVEIMKLTKKWIEVTMFAGGNEDFQNLQNTNLAGG